MQISKQDVPRQFHELIKRTEDNIEQLILHLHGMRPEDLPLIKWEWDEWQPALLNEDTYPQFHAQEKAGAKLYQVLWAIPLCGRDQNQHWHDKERLDKGTAEQVLLFQMELMVDASGGLQNTALECFLGLYDGCCGTPGRSVESIVRIPNGNEITVTVPLLVKMTRRIEDLVHQLKLEHRAKTVMRDIEHLHESWAAEAIRNRPPE